MNVARRGGWQVFALALLAAFATASIGGSVTDLGDWYQNLVQPDWKPTDKAFGPVWTTIFTLIGVSAALAWRGAANTNERVKIVASYVANGALNVGWSFAFFKLHRPDWSLIEIVPLWLSIVVMMLVAWRSSKLAALLLVPYLAWVSFAGVLNKAVVDLNGPF